MQLCRTACASIILTVRTRKVVGRLIFSCCFEKVSSGHALRAMTESEGFVTGISNSWQLRLGQFFNFSFHYNNKKWILDHVAHSLELKLDILTTFSQALLCDISTKIHSFLFFQFFRKWMDFIMAMKNNLVWGNGVNLENVIEDIPIIKKTAIVPQEMNTKSELSSSRSPNRF